MGKQLTMWPSFMNRLARRQCRGQMEGDAGLRTAPMPCRLYRISSAASGCLRAT